ncbi:hypothetical protein PCL_10748 [Purpureocillium lilacinum]|uniref:Uncharacterized protein n=1 Tax=Purpureocillium lilacinum TaxID=33203 RepID=A0A179G1G2_PURLI|nr:hypothetical protein VFPBJ_10461 [Purpureocillium lilacinum]PWI72125.1 hypothetical protein PCL_10748 [Purpureocillium lilacinum]GJN71259.1 hypothetical protein PLICBS_005322 [Purpureocillium lilacinum]
MKLTAVAAAAALALAPTTEAWRVYLYHGDNQSGTYYTNSGPGGSGSRCHLLPREHVHKARSIEYYATNSQSNPTTRCKIQMFETNDCGGRQGPYYQVDTKKNFKWDWVGVIQSYKTTCWRE